MRSYLAYQFPNGSPRCLAGKWIKSSLENIPKGAFFVTDFLKEAVYFFEEEKTVEHWNDSELFFTELDSTHVLSQDEYIDHLTRFQGQFDELGIRKAIFSRIYAQPLSDKGTNVIFNQLIQRYGANTLVYMISSPELGTWLGATPEVLLESKGEDLHTMSLAGTKKDDSIPWTIKEREEQQLVTDYVLAKVNSFPHEKLEFSEVETISSGCVQHLRTRFTLRLSTQYWLSLVESLHPTPAVGGLPKEQAVQHIVSSEIHSRGLYTGLLGIMDTEKIQVFVNLRCMQVFESAYGLYVGGGITHSSIPFLEWEETMNKAETLLSVITNSNP